MTQALNLRWPTPGSNLPDLAHRLIGMANEVQFVEIGFDGDAPGEPAAGAVREIERALGDAIDAESDDEREAIAVRLMGLLRSLRDDGLALTANYDQRTVEGAAGVGKFAVLSIVVDRQGVPWDQAAA